MSDVFGVFTIVACKKEKKKEQIALDFVLDKM